MGEAFRITALDAYASDLAPEGALSAAVIRQNPGKKPPQSATSNIRLASEREALALVILMPSKLPLATRPLFAHIMLVQTGDRTDFRHAFNLCSAPEKQHRLEHISRF